MADSKHGDATATTGLTDYHAKLLAHELTRRCASDSVERLAGALSNAQVDLNPHQVEAALFAFRNPFSKGAILADEVGLGKTIEAGLLLSQKWAERKRRLLVVAPANLRKQWSQEMADKFHLPSIILEARSFNQAQKAGKLNPFDQPDEIVLCSYQFVKSKVHFVRQVSWDLVVIDEAHRLRNVYKKSSRTALAIKDALAPFPKVLLTATPLQNSLMELYGLVGIIDEFAFGDQKSFQKRFTRLASEGDFEELKERLKPVCKRTLRRQVLEYIKYTNRHAIVQEFEPSLDEQALYDRVTDYMQQPTLYAMPAGQRQLMTSILRKLLASSTFAVANTLQGFVEKLEKSTKGSAPDDPIYDVPPATQHDFDGFEESAEEWGAEDDEDGEDGDQPQSPGFSSEQLDGIRQETALLRDLHRLAHNIQTNSKGETLLMALRKGFDASLKAQQGQGAATLSQKALIFTESRKTQEYLFKILQGTEFAGKVAMFNGSNTDALSKEIYERWRKRHSGTDRVTGSPSADMRAALVEHFRDEATILLATEAAAEGVNMQFCNLVVNYDLPWNPQRIEQRIGRCHRYGQKFDVVVVNFLNKANAADVRVHQLLREKFKLFDGVFGASDEVLGVVEAGVEFEKRIAAIYHKCRSPQQIDFEFNEFQTELEAKITEGRSNARAMLLDNFDQEVIEKVKVESNATLSRFQARLWALTRNRLADHAAFVDADYSFTLHDNPFPETKMHVGPYRMGKAVEDANTYRIGHPLAQHVVDGSLALVTPDAELTFDLTGSGRNIAALSPHIGKGGWLAIDKLTITALDAEDEIVFAGTTDDGATLGLEECRRLFDLPARAGAAITPSVVARAGLEQIGNQHKEAILSRLTERDGKSFDVENDKLDKWADDRRSTLKAELEELEEEIKAAKKSARVAPTQPEKHQRQREVRKLETKRDEAFLTFHEAARAVEAEKDRILDNIAARLEQATSSECLFTVRWRVV
jgi:superfamily II DNA or RNA helicase